MHYDRILHNSTSPKTSILKHFFIMAAWKSITLLVLIAKSISGFNVGRTTRSRSSVMSPLFYTDVDPEISSITISPPVINGATSIFVEERLAFDKVGTKRKQATKPIEVKVSRRTSPTTPSSLSTTITSDRFVTKRKQHNTSIEVNVSRPTSSRTTRPKPDDDVGDASDMMPKSVKPHKTVWLTRYNELKAYKSQKGHCMLPQSYAPNPKLGLWVMQQRRQYTLQQRGKNSSFDGPNGTKRIRLLEELGFVWRVERGGPRGSYKSSRRMKYHAESNVDIEDEIMNVVDFESYMLGKSREYTDEEKREAWRHRFAFFR
jgi:hypothetical protein